MNDQKIHEPGQIYSLVRSLAKSCRDNDRADIATQLDDALHLGSSSLEILGAIRGIVISHREYLEDLVASNEIEAAIRYIDKTFGRSPERW